MPDTTPAGGKGPRARRMKQEDLRELMLKTAEDLLDGRGLGVNAYPLNMEELIREVGVPRSSAFHTFGSKENLVFQLALRLLPPESPLATHFSGMWRRTADDVVGEYPGREDAAGRWSLLREVIRRAVRLNHDMLAGSARWRTFRALSMSLDSFPDNERDVLSERLQSIQHQYVSTMGECYAEMFERFGVRLRTGIDIHHFTSAASSTLEGIATDKAFSPSAPDQLLSLPGVDGEPVEWHLAPVAFLALVEGMTEPRA